MGLPPKGGAFALGASPSPRRRWLARREPGAQFVAGLAGLWLGLGFGFGWAWLGFLFLINLIRLIWLGLFPLGLGSRMRKNFETVCSFNKYALYFITAVIADMAIRAIIASIPHYGSDKWCQVHSRWSRWKAIRHMCILFHVVCGFYILKSKRGGFPGMGSPWRHASAEVR